MVNKNLAQHKCLVQVSKIKIIQKVEKIELFAFLKKKSLYLSQSAMWFWGEGT